ncbi:MAG: lipoate--protein ligase family protein [Candidatus Rokubacteria bacterium]|nr:lipoate--protein ligase family protein [Candidatus Rokubacteria bacterium]
MGWRYIADDGVGAAAGLAADEAVTRRQGSGESPPTLRLYTYRSHCALVGRFQRLGSELRLDECRRVGVEVNRRPTGGGAIIMGADQLGIAIMTRATAGERSYDRTRELFARFSSGLTGALGEVGIAAEYRRKNDVEVGGKKIAGLGIYFDPAGGMLFHASLLVDLDVAFMLSVLRTPFEKISDKEIATVSERMTTVRRELGRQVSTAEVRELVRAAYARALGLELEPGPFSPEERLEIAALARDRYQTEEWLAREPATPDAMGSATVKTPGGLLTAHLTLAGEVIKAIYFTGDFFTDDTVLAGMERALRWHPVGVEAVTETLEALRRREALALPGVPSEAVARAVELASGAARRHEQAGTAKGCFVNP